MINVGLTANQLEILRTILPHNLTVKLFGSRIKGGYRENSDLDVCILSDVPRSEVTKLIEQLEESRLPFTVDVVMYKDCTDDFKKIIDNTGISL